MSTGRFIARSVGRAALLNDELRFMGAAEVAMEAIEKETTIR